MKTILIATGFSTASRNAALYGVEMAAIFNARVVLFSAYRYIIPVTETPVVISSEDMRDLTQQQLEEEAKAINPLRAVHIETVCKEGTAADIIVQVASEKNADLIIAGMKAESKGIRRVLGSVATELARKTGVPLVIVPEEATFTRVETIALANEDDLAPDADSGLLNALREIAERFHSKVYLVRITKNKFQEAYEVLNRPFKINRMLRTTDPVYECIEGKDVPVALNDFIKGYKVNMLAMLPHKHNLLERWFGKSATRSMIFETHIPLLILPDLHIQKPASSNIKREASL